MERRDERLADPAPAPPPPPLGEAARGPWATVLGWTWRLGRVAGVPIRLHWSLVVLLPWVVAQGLADPLTGWLNAGYAALRLVGLFGCVTLHELGHGLAARRLGYRVRDITLLPIGGVARLEARAGRLWPPGEVAVALAGPAVNLGLALLLLPATWALSGAAREGPGVLLRELDHLSPAGFLATLLLANGLLAGFNLLPIFPMDGGRVLRALLAWRGDEGRATRRAALVGQALAVALAGVGVWAMSAPLVVVALVLAVGGGRALAEARAGEPGEPGPGHGD